jgi:2-aminoadipate transaminase
VDRRVERLQRQCVETEGLLSLAGGLPAAQTFPVAALAQALERTQSDALQYDWPEGRGALRAWVAKRLTQRGAPVDPDDVLVTSGAQQALDIALRLVTSDEHRVRVPEACYPGALELFSAYGSTLVGTAEAAELEYTMPVVENPTGRMLGTAERAEILRASHWIIEDDAYAELRFDGRLPRPLLAEAPDRVLHVGTLSKTLCPGLRIGWLVVPPPLRERARSAKHRTDLQGNTLAQSIVEGYLDRNDYDERLARLRQFYANQAELLGRALGRHLPTCSFEHPGGGFSLWLTTDEAWDDVELLRMAISCGTSFDPGRDFRRDGASRPLALRLAFSSLRAEDIDEAVRRLARAFSEFARGERVSCA